MIGRILASLAFVAGGIGTGILFAALSIYASSQIGMSAGVIPKRSVVDSLIPWFACSYFLVSAVGVVVWRKHEALRIVAVIAHLLLLAAFLALCSTGMDKGIGKFLSGLAVLSGYTVVFFSPWAAVWAFILSRAE